MPADYEIYATGAYKGRDLDFAIDDSNHRATAFEVAVHVPNRNVVLILGAYDPAVWTVRWSRETQVVGVWLSGYYAQQIHSVTFIVSRGVPRPQGNPGHSNNRSE